MHVVTAGMYGPLMQHWGFFVIFVPQKRFCNVEGGSSGDPAGEGETVQRSLGGLGAGEVHRGLAAEHIGGGIEA